MKSCIVCGAELTENNWEPAQQRNWINKCRDCLKEEKRNYQKAWRKSNPSKSAERTKRHRIGLLETDPVKYRARSAYNDCRKRALKNGLEFDLTVKFLHDLLLSNSTCPYFGWLLTFAPGKNKTLASIDRVDSAKGYTKDNVQVVSYLANLMKSSASLDDLIAFAQGVLRLSHHNEAEK